ncbi:hypothetical protein yc1106_06310 [Curvularia clavata]|uniref:Uncharacterized protein n=1 Tax=Curvularia clavata TaxID=95742 RepID=A0A9Q8ZB87_CURCL|nr:hypothetical protein yc1106_06310 [Curvularia clavata]
MEQSEPSARPLLSARGNEERTNQVELLPMSNTAQKSIDAESVKSTHSGLNSKNGGNVSKHMWGQSWTLETLSLVVSILGLAGLIATLLAHQSKPLPQWPQLVTINSIISLFSLLMRTCVGVVLTEGPSSQSNVPTEFAPMSAAVNVGLLQTTGDLTNLLSSGCSSGNCTFSDNGNASFSTLAFTHSCVDITSNIRIVNETQNSGNSTTTYLALDYEYNQTMEWMGETGGEGVLRSWVPSTDLESYVVYFLFRSSQYTTDWRAANCSLFPTVNTYAAAIKDAKLEERELDLVHVKPILSQFPDPPNSDYNLTSSIAVGWSHGITTDYTIRNGKREACEGSDSDGPGMFSFMQHSDDATYVNGTGFTQPSAGWKWSYFPMDCVWLVNRFAYLTITESLDTIFDKKNLTTGYHGGSISGPVHLQVLFEGGNITVSTIDKRMSNLATAMTSIVRTNPDPPDYPVKRPDWMPYNAEGEMWVNTTCVYVRWPWITFPAAEILLSGIFLILVAIDSRGIEPDRLWKSSFLAALFCEVEVDKQLVGKKEMEEMAKSTSVSLAVTSQGLRLIR